MHGNWQRMGETQIRSVSEYRAVCDTGSSKPGLVFVVSVFLHPSWPGQSGGTLTNYLLMKFLANSFRVTVVTLKQAGEDYTIFARDGISVIPVPPPSWSSVGTVLKWRSFVRKVSGDVLGRLTDVRWLVASTSTLQALRHAAPGSGLLSCAIIQAYENFGLFPPKVSLQTRARLLRTWIKHGAADSTLLRGADVILANSAFMKDALHRRIGVDPELVRVVPPICDIGADMMPAPANTVGFVSRGTDKNYRLVRNLAALAPDLDFLVYGTSPDVLPAGPPNIHIKGWCSDRTAMFGSAGIWIMPALWAEPFGRVSMEAQACGRPVVVANVGGLPETVLDPGWLVDGYDPKVWLDRIRRVMRTPEDVLKRNQVEIASRFSLDAHAQALQEIFVAK